MTQTEIYLVQGLAVLFFFGFLPIMLFMIARDKLQRYAITHVLSEFLTPQQTGFTKMLREVGGFVQLPSPDKEGIPKTFPVGTDATVTVGWPDYFPRMLKVIARKMIFHTSTWEPLSRIGENNPILDPILRPEFLTIIQAETASARVIRGAQEDALQEIPTRGRSRIKITFTHILLIFLLIGITIILVWGIQNAPAIMAGLGID